MNRKNKSSPIHILWVEESDEGFSVAKPILDASELDSEIVWEQHADNAIHQLQSRPFDIVLLSVDPSFGLGMIKTIISQKCDIPIIFVAEIGNEAAAVDAIALGAHHYLMKDADGEYIRLLPTLLRQTQQHAQRLLQSPTEVDMTARMLINASLDVVILIDEEGIICNANEPASQALGKPKEELVGLSIWHLQDEDTVRRRKPYFEEAVRTKRFVRWEGTYADGNWFDNVIYPILTPQKEIGQLAIVARNITNYRQTAQQLQSNLAQMMILQEMDIELAHNLDLDYVLSRALDCAMRLSVADAGFIGLLEDNHIHVKKMLGIFPPEMIDNILMVGRAQAGQVDFNPDEIELELFCNLVIDQVCFADESEHKFEFISEVGDLKIMADGDLLHHIISNLLTNAFKYTPEKGQITFELDQDDEYVVIKVSDEGIGIPQEDLSRLFEPFHRAGNVGKVKGTGLGLSIVKQYVELHGGRVEVESTGVPGEGSTFSVWLPIKGE